MKKNICIIGAGNVAQALAQRLFEKGHTISQIYSRTASKTNFLAEKVAAQSCHQLKDLNPNADYYLMAISDDAIQILAQQLSGILAPEAIVAHSSGATPIDVFEGNLPNYGVFYPLQTFSVQRKANFDELPFCIAGNNTQSFEKLFQLAQTICPNVYAIDEAQRQALHVAAVFVNNFSNRLFTIGEELCQQEGIDFEILKPLIKETLRKIEVESPKDMQTGPAQRGDQGTIQRHLNWLSEKAATHKKIYELMTQSIIKAKQKS